MESRVQVLVTLLAPELMLVGMLGWCAGAIVAASIAAPAAAAVAHDLLLIPHDHQALAAAIARAFGYVRL